MASKHARENQRFAEECEYLIRLLETNGNANVPSHTIPSYFRTQAAAATRAHFYCLAVTLENAAYELRAGFDDKMRELVTNALRGHILALKESKGRE